MNQKKGKKWKNLKFNLNDNLNLLYLLCLPTKHMLQQQKKYDSKMMIIIHWIICRKEFIIIKFYVNHHHHEQNIIISFSFDCHHHHFEWKWKSMKKKILIKFASCVSKNFELKNLLRYILSFFSKNFFQMIIMMMILIKSSFDSHY